MNYSFVEAYANYLQNINAESFAGIALSLFQMQYEHNELYRNFTQALHIDPFSVQAIERIPFLPVSFFKTHTITSVPEAVPQLVFESSGTTGEMPSRHHVADASLYEASLLAGFRQYYGDPSAYVILALLPSYLERQNASLVHMARVLMQQGNDPRSGFYLDDFDGLHQQLTVLEQEGKKTLLLGVTFALLDFAQVYPMRLEHTIVMETGGMKGRKAEWTRQQVHDLLKRQWQLEHVHSEYGMTELLSQAYAKRDGIFLGSDTMRVLVRDMNDPLDVRASGTGCLNIIDLANRDSCAFIATEDIGQVNADGSFTVLGRMDHAALRGCSLMAV